MRKLLYSFLITVMLLGGATSGFSAWESGEGGPTGPINSLFYKDSKLYATSLTTGVYMSVNQGYNWIERNSKLPVTNVGTINVIGTRIFIGTEGSGIFMSSNDGEDWKATNTGLGNMYVYSLAADGTKLYAGTDEGGVFLTSDNGSNWTSVNDGSISYPVLAMAATSGKVFVGTSFGGLFETTNNGTSWMNINPNVIKFDVTCIAVSGNKYFVGTKDGGVYFSSDDGANWSSVSTGLKTTHITSLLVNGSNVFAATKGGGVFFTDNDGKLWYDVSDNLPEKEVFSLCTDDTYLFAGTGSSSIVRRKLNEFAAPEVTAPVLASPLDGTTGLDTAVTLTWNSVNGAVSYHAIISTDPNFSAGTIITEKDGLINTFLQVPALAKNTKYYWKAATNTVSQEKKWSGVWNFTTKAVLSAPGLLLPGDNLEDIDIPITFVWQKASGAVSYILQVCEINTFDSLYAINQSAIIDTFYTTINLKPQFTYFWRVAAVGSDDKREFSKVSTFKSGNILSVEPSEVSDGGLSLSCYPNPATDNFTVNFITPMNVNSELKLIDALGNQTTLFSGVSASASAINVSTNKLGSSYYRLILTSSGKSVSLPIIIIK